MSHTCTSLLCHCAFSTKERRPLLQEPIMPRVTQYIGGIIRSREGKLLELGGTEDHVHLLMSLHPKHSLSTLLRDIKSNSSGWVHDMWPNLRSFHWQEGFAIFTVSMSNLAAVATYIQAQKEHHRQMTFQQELLCLLQKHEIEYDERYIFE